MESMKHLVGLTVKQLVASFCWILSPSYCVLTSPNPSAVQFTSVFLVFWVGLKRGGPLGQHLCKLSTHSHIVTFIQGINVGQGVLSWNWAVLPWGRGDVGKVKLFFFTFFNISNLGIFFFLQLCAGTSPIDSWTFTNVLLSIGDFKTNVLWGDDSRKLLFCHVGDIALLRTYFRFQDF